MPIRINLLAEQQAAEEARRKDPVKRAIIVCSAVSFLFVVWAVMAHMQLKAKRAELVNLDGEFKRVDEKAKLVRATIANTGDIEKRMSALERYSTNRVLWASMLDAMQRGTDERIRFKELGTRQDYTTLPTNAFFTTTVYVPYTPPKPMWKFWASTAPQPDPMRLASNEFKTLTNSTLQFTTNKLPYKVNMTVKGTNLQNNTISVECIFILPFVTGEKVDITIRGRDYGTPPGVAEEFKNKLISLPYFVAMLGTNDLNRAFFREKKAIQEKDPLEPNGPGFLPFVLELNYQRRVLLNE